jgi:hypothetical protein
MDGFRFIKTRKKSTRFEPKILNDKKLPKTSYISIILKGKNIRNKTIKLNTVNNYINTSTVKQLYY